MLFKGRREPGAFSRTGTQAASFRQLPSCINRTVSPGSWKL
jgi:hypothetical protein